MSDFIFYNRGSITPFSPNQKVKGPDGNMTTLLEFHKQLVIDADRRDVYLTNHKGKEVICRELLEA